MTVTLNGVIPSTAATPGMTLLASDTTERTTAAGSAVDLVTLTGLSIAVTTPLLAVIHYHKTAGAAAAPLLGLKINATTVYEASAGGHIAKFSATDQVEDGVAQIIIGPRVALYVAGALTTYQTTNSGGFGGAQAFGATAPSATIPVATITDFIIRGSSASASVTLGVQSVFLYALATS